MLGGLAQSLDRDELVIYYNAVAGTPRFSQPVRERFIRMPNRTLWNQVRVPLAARQDRLDVYLGTAAVVPTLLSTPSVVIVHDCLAIRDPASKPGADGRYWRRWLRSSVRHARRVIAVSEDTARDCRELLGVPADRTRVVLNGVGREFLAGDRGDIPGARAMLAARGVQPGRYLLQVGAFDRHKGADVALETTRVLRGRGHDVALVQCGPGGPKSPPDEPWHVVPGIVDDDILRALYSDALALLVCSTHEGFGLPVLEAMALGTPVVTTRAGALPEAGGDVALYVDPGDAPGFASAVEQLTDPEFGAKRAAEGVRRAATFTWERAAAATMEILREAIA